jgi:hypothetical protein
MKHTIICSNSIKLGNSQNQQKLSFISIFEQNARHMKHYWYGCDFRVISNASTLNVEIVNFPFICSNMPAAPAYGVYISQLIRYYRAYGSYQDFLDRRLLLTRKLLNQGFLLVKMKPSLRKFYCRHHDLVDRYRISVSQVTTEMFHLS